jgi:hypothetical protein
MTELKWGGKNPAALSQEAIQYGPEPDLLAAGRMNRPEKPGCLGFWIDV